MIEPLRCAFMYGNTAREVTMMLYRLTSMILRP